MKKTYIASAIAAATLSTSAFAMDPATDLAEMLESMPEFYGNIQLVHTNANEDKMTTTATPKKFEDSTHELSDNGSTFGIKHSHAISEGVEGFLKAEFEFAADDDNGKGITKLDEAYIGVKGDFGSVQVGSDDTVYEWVDMIDTSEAVGLSGEIADLEEGDNLQYVSPEIADGLVVGLTVPFDGSETDSTFGGALAAKYSVDNLDVVLAYGLGHNDSEDTIGLAGTYSMGDIALIAQYETQDENEDYIGLQGMYTMGANVFALGYSMTSFDASSLEDESSIYVQGLHNVSDHTYVYLEYTTTSDLDGAEGFDKDALAIGAAYSF